MYHRVRRKMFWHYILIAIAIIHDLNLVQSHTIDRTSIKDDFDFDNNIIDFDSAYDVKLDKRFDKWDAKSKESYRYSVHKIVDQIKNESASLHSHKNKKNSSEESTTESNSVPVELLSTTNNPLYSLQDSTEDIDLTVIPLSTTQSAINIEVSTVTLPPSSTSNERDTTEFFPTEALEAFGNLNNKSNETISRSDVLKLSKDITYVNISKSIDSETNHTENHSLRLEAADYISSEIITENITETSTEDVKNTTIALSKNITIDDSKKTKHHIQEIQNINATEEKLTAATRKKYNETERQANNKTTKTENVSLEQEDNVPIFTELDTASGDHIPEDYYDAKDVVPTKPPNTDVLSVIFGLAGSVVESMAERVVPKGIFDLFKRMQKQNEALEAEKLRSREENGGIGQFGRDLIKSISNGLSRPFTQLMAGARDNGSLDSNSSFVGLDAGVTTVTNVANSLVEAFKNRVQAIYPGTLWCGDGHSAQARSGDLGLFFFTDTCCRQHDACKLYIQSGDTKYGLTNTGLFTRSHCSCDAKFRGCLQQTGSLVSAQIGLTYFNVLGPQCFRRAHPIVRCVRRTRITGQKCEEYELDYTKPKMWQWFDNQTF